MQKVILIVLGLALIVGGVFYFWKSPLNKRNLAGLKIESTPEAQVSLDGKDLGLTPIDGSDFQPGEYTVKLTSGSLTWENKIKLFPNVKTYVKRDLGDSDRASSGVILTLEKSMGGKIELEVVSTPDKAAVTLSGENKGNTPLIISDTLSGKYDLQVSTTGYKSQTVKIQMSANYKLNAAFELAVDETVQQPTPSASPSASGNPKTSPAASAKSTPSASVSASPKLNNSPPPKPYIQVLETPTNYLNVRAEPNKSAEILTKIYPNEYYAYLDEQGTGEDIWYKIYYAENKMGWISGQYAKKFEKP